MPTAEAAPFLMSLEHGTPIDLWATSRSRCAEALFHGEAFVMVIKGGLAFADDAILSKHERERAARYRRAQDRLNFVLGRTAIEWLLGPRGMSPRRPVAIAPTGKPFVVGAPEFSISHSGAYFAIGVSRSGCIGIDVETFDRMGNPQELFSSVTHARERSILETSPPTSVGPLFRRCWTRKEAVLKATGIGLNHDLSAVDTRLAEHLPVIESPGPIRIADIFADGDATAAIALDPRIGGVRVLFVEVNEDKTTVMHFP